MKRSYISLFILGLTVSSPAFSDDSNLEEFGDIMQFALPIAGFAGTYIADDEEGRKQFVYSFATAIGTTTVLKGVFSKMRPSSDSRTSFPSGHTTSAFQGASFIDIRYGHLYGVPAYALAGLTAYSRYESDNHFVDDILAGASIGVLSNLLWTTPFDTQGASIKPMPLGDGYGLSMTVTDFDAIQTNKKASHDGPAQGRYQISLGGADLKRNHIASPSDTGTSFDLAQFDLEDNPTTTAVALFDWYVAPRHMVSFSLSPFESRDSGHFNNPTSFEGTVFPENTPIQSSWRMTDISALYSYDLIPNTDWGVYVGGGLTVQRTIIKLRTEDKATSAKVTDVVVLPIVSLGVDYNFTPKWNLAAEAAGMDLSSDKYLSGTVQLTYSFNDSWDIGGGVGIYRRNIDTSDLKNDIKYDLAFISVGYTFY